MGLAATSCGTSAETTAPSTVAPSTTATTASPAAAPEPDPASPATAAPVTTDDVTSEPLLVPELAGTFPTSDGSSIDLATLQGEDVVLWFWAPW